MNSEPWSIRPATPDDTDAIVSIWLTASRESHQFVPHDVWLSHADDMRDVYLPASESYVAADSAGMVVGFMSLVDDEVAALFVEPSCQGVGIGRSLLEQARTMREALTLSVYVANGRAVSFYLENGFRPQEERTDEKTGRREVRMRWDADD